MVTCQKFSHLKSQVFTLNLAGTFCRLLGAKKFSRNPGQLIWVTTEVRYHVSIAKLAILNLKSQVAELVLRPWTLMRILYFSGEHQICKNWRRRSLYMTGIENFSIYGPGRHNLGEGREFQQNYRPRKPLGHISLEKLDKVYAKNIV